MTQPKKRVKTTDLGTLRLNAEPSPNYYEYVSTIRSDKGPVKLVLYSDVENGSLDEAIRCASILCQTLEKVVSQSIDCFIVEKVVPAINEHLRPHDPLSQSDFLDELKLSIIHVHSNGDASFWFDPNDLMLEHSLVLYGDYEGLMSDFAMPG